MFHLAPFTAVATSLTFKMLRGADNPPCQKLDISEPARGRVKVMTNGRLARRAIQWVVNIESARIKM